MKKFYRISVVLFVSSVLLFSCQPTNDEVKPASTTKLPKDYSADAVLAWGNMYLELSRYASGYRPPVSGRALGYIGLAGYEAMVGGSKEYLSIQGYYAGLSIPKPDATATYHWGEVVNAAYAYMHKAFFPHVSDALKGKIEATQKSLEDKFSAETDATTFERSKKYGESVATAIFNWSKTDTWGHEAFLNNIPADYKPPVGVFNWQPTYPDYTKALLPYWGNVRTFVATEDDKVARPPVAFSSSPTSQFYAQANEVYATVNSATYEQKWIAQFWSDDVYQLTFEPAARWIAVADQVIAADKIDLEKAAFAHAKVGMALCDAGIVCWNSKYIYNVERPISYIRKYIDPNWVTLLANPILNFQGVTPPFPAYPSGHSTFGAAAGEVLSNTFGYQHPMTDRCHENRTEFIGTPRAFNNFNEMAIENAYSRVPLGVHYRMDCDEGVRMGNLVGRKINALRWKK